MRYTSFALPTVALLLLGCDQPTTTEPMDGSPSLTSGSTVTNQVTASGSDADFIGPGGDANFSLSAQLRADGSASGQWTDQFGLGNGGFHAVIDCVFVLGNQAWVSGIITSGQAGGVDLTGLPVATRVQDNGTSANDPPDLISFSFVGDPNPCTNQVPYPLNPKTLGQVVVR